MNSDGISLPFVVIGSGITADFTYPILNLQHSTPNPDKESVIFGNTNAYKRVFDSYRGNQTENYLVGTFNKDVNHSQTLNEMNQTAQDKMS
jgi:putative ABC transport system permease protein